MSDAFYRPLGQGTFASTEHTVGPWTPDAQHFGPPAALLARAIEGVPAAHDAQLARITVEVLGPVPVSDVEVAAELIRPGRSVELLSASMHANGRAVARAHAWRIARADSASVADGAAPPLPAPARGASLGRSPGWEGGYLDAMEWRALAGGFASMGPATVWVRQRVVLVDGECPSPVQRLLAVADSGNGASARLDPREWYFINSELTVHMHREAVGEWIGLDAATVVGPSGIGTASSVLYDETGQVGRGAQALLIRPRP